VTDCQIVDEDYRRILRLVRDYFAALKEQGVAIPFYHRLRHTGYLRHLVVRRAKATGEILVALVTTTQWPAETADTQESGGTPQACRREQEVLEELRERLMALPLAGKIVGILHVKNDSLADAVHSDETVILYGRDYFYEELLGLTFRVSLFSFFQTNSLGAELLYQTAREYISDCAALLEKGDGAPESGSENRPCGAADEYVRGKIVYDLYSGTGTIAQMLAPAAKKVIGVEIVEEAVLAARENAALNGLHNCEFIAGDVLKVLDEIAEKPDVIVLDPPRDGVHPKAIQKIIDYGVDHILYISCKASSLARDLAVFIGRGYEAVRCVPIDQFPWTTGVETVCLLSKLHVEHHIEVDVNLDEMDLTKVESKATYAEIKEYVLEHTGLKVSNLYIAQVKRKCGIIERSNYNLPKSEDSRQPKCPLEKEGAIREALKAFQMI